MTITLILPRKQIPTLARMIGGRCSVVEELLNELNRLGVVLVASGGDRLRFRPRAAVTPGLVNRLKERKAEILTFMANTWPEAEPWPESCPECGGLELWETPTGKWRCMKCDPPRKAQRLLERTERIRRRHVGRPGLKRSLQ